MSDTAAKADESPPWFKRRGYPHFDRTLSPKQAELLVMDASRVARQPFLPFIAFNLEQQQYKKQPDGTRRITIKSRSVPFASHADSHIFAYYSHVLAERYERILAHRGLTECVLAYRRFIPAKCNIHFANETFGFIEGRGECTALALDIEKFFDTIPHRDLKRLWAQVQGVERLPEDHYAVLKAVTRWAKVDRDEVFAALGIGLRQRQSWRGPLCTPAEFRDRVRGMGLIKPGYEVRTGQGVGIPQGSPISAVLSNIIMLEVDTEMQAAALAAGGLYRRYSDDVMLIGSAEAAADLECRLKACVGRLGLEVNDGKTVRSVFQPSPDGLLAASRPLQYLGFTFDGRRVLVRSQTLSKYIQRMKRGVRSARRAAIAAARKGGSRRLHRQELIARYSHLGPTPAMRERDRTGKLGNNFWTYTERASERMGRPEILRQLRKHWPRLNAEIKMADEG